MNRFSGGWTPVIVFLSLLCVGQLLPSDVAGSEPLGSHSGDGTGEEGVTASAPSTTVPAGCDIPGFTFVSTTLVEDGYVCELTRPAESTPATTAGTVPASTTSTTVVKCPDAPQGLSFVSSSDSDGVLTCTYDGPLPDPQCADAAGYTEVQVRLVDGVWTCERSRSTTTTRPADVSYTCPSAPSGYSFDRRSGSTCYYSRGKTEPADVSHTCPSAPSTYSFDRRSGSTCHYTRSGSTTGGGVPIGTDYTCPSAPLTYSYDRRDGETCHYKRSPSTTRSASSSTTYSCPDAPSTFTYSRRNGSTCYYTRSTTTTRTVSYVPGIGTVCPAAPSTYSYSRRSGNTCYYTRSGSTTLTAASSTRHSCPSVSTFTYQNRTASHVNGFLVGYTCHYTRSGTTTRSARTVTSYACASTRPGGFTYSSQSGSTCHYTRTPTSTTRTAPATYSCDSLSGWDSVRRSGQTCHYHDETTKPATVSHTCPSAPTTFTFSHRSGDTCHYTRSGSFSQAANLCPSVTGFTNTGRDASSCHYEWNPTESDSSSVSTTTTVVSSAVHCPTIVPLRSRDRTGNRCAYHLKIPDSLTLSAPTNLIAYGHNPSVTARDKASVTIDWDDVPGADWYWIQYMPWDKRYALTGPAWNARGQDEALWDDYYVFPNSNTGLLDSEVVLPRPNPDHPIGIKQLFTVRVRAMSDNRQSAWKRVYAYATTTDTRFTGSNIYTGIPRLGEKIAFSMVTDEPRSIWKSYTYIICQGTIPGSPTGGHLDNWLAEIESGLDSWERPTKGLVTATRDTDTNARNRGRECNARIDLSTLPDNVVSFAVRDSVRMYLLCERWDGACVRGGAGGTRHIILDDVYDIAVDRTDFMSLTTCSSVYRGLQHEVGHIYGLAHNYDYDNLTVMRTNLDLFCRPTEYDIVAVRAIHQSGYDYATQ